jgi:chemotaxis protein methyltransferase CheR
VTTREPEPLIADPEFLLLKDYVVASTGLAYYRDKDADFARRIARRLVTLDIGDCASYLRLLRDPALGTPELDALISEITISETYFFRHREHFEALRDVVFPDLIARSHPKRALRIWSAGCSYGPEPYSVGILFSREIEDRFPGWDISIVGTDINRRSLAAAREGKFRKWALRSTSGDVRNACFVEDGDVFQLLPEFRERVSFQYHNLVEDHLPSSVNNLFAFDLIVCRNVIIYFDPLLSKKIIDRFHQCLVPGGWLLVGPTEPNLASFLPFRTVNAPGVTLYQKPPQPAPPVVRFTPAVFSPVAAPAPLPGAPFPVSESPAPALEAPLAAIRRLSDHGAWDEAILCCEQLIAIDNMNPIIHFHHALLLEQIRNHAEAERSLKAAIYLDRRYVLAHYYLGMFLQSRGDSGKARRCFENALELLDVKPDRERFAEADGISVAELKKLARMHLEILREKV